MPAGPTHVLARVARVALVASAALAASPLNAQGPAAPDAAPASVPTDSSMAGGDTASADPEAAANQERAPGRLGPGSQAELGLDLKPQYKILRYDEDYSYLKDPSRRVDFWDPLKYIPFGGRDDFFLSIGGQARPRFEMYHNLGFGEAPANSQGNNQYLMQRYMFHGDLHLGKRLRFFLQDQVGLIDGRIGGPRPDVDLDRHGFHQGFVDVVVPLDDEEEGDTLTLRPGRQEMLYGSGRLIDVREGTNLRRSFDAARVLARLGEWQVDGFWGRPVRNRPLVFDDDPDHDLEIWGVYGVRPLSRTADLHGDFYYLGYRNLKARFDQDSGRELRHSIGARLWGRPMPWEYNLEYVVQFGSFGRGGILAWTASQAVRYNFTELPFRPKLAIRADLASGDRDPNSPTLGTFNPMFPSGAYFNLGNPIGPQNIVDFHPIFNFDVGEDVTVTADWNFFWRESTGDGLYSLSGQLLRTADSGTSRYIGNAPSITAAWRISRHVTLLGSYARFNVGPFIQAQPPAKDVDFVTVWLDYLF